MTDQKPKISFKPHHGKTYKKYSIHSKNHNGTVKFIGNMMAQNDELAFAKARENFEVIIEHGVILIILPRG